MTKKIEVSNETWEKIKDQVGPQEDVPEGSKMRICIVDNRGLTFVGQTDLTRDSDGLISIYGARCIIQWGTTGHLAEAAKGPTKSTKLGDARTVRVNDVVVVYECGDGWDE